MACQRSPQPGPEAPRETAVVIPSIGSSTLAGCLDAVARLDPPPRRTVVVLSGPSPAPACCEVEILRSERALGFAAAVNHACERVLSGCEQVALLNDDAAPPPHWLRALGDALAADDEIAAVQGTIVDPDGHRIDGRGIELDRWGLPIQQDRGAPAAAETAGELRQVLAVSGTGALFRSSALARVSVGRLAPLDPAFGSYHEDLDLGLRLRRLGFKAFWVGGAPVRHAGSATGVGMRWRHPWWLLANRWRALAGNLTPGGLVRLLPRLLRGEIRALRTLARHNPRAMLVEAGVAASWPTLVARGWLRSTPGDRLRALPEQR